MEVLIVHWEMMDFLLTETLVPSHVMMVMGETVLVKGHVNSNQVKSDGVVEMSPVMQVHIEHALIIVLSSHTTVINTFYTYYYT